MYTEKMVQDKDRDTAYTFELTFTIHVEDEAEANKAVAKLLDEAESLGIRLVWKQPVL